MAQTRSAIETTRTYKTQLLEVHVRRVYTISPTVHGVIVGDLFVRQFTHRDFQILLCYRCALNASDQSGCQRERGGRFSMMSPADQAIRLASSSSVTSLSGQVI